MTLKIISSTDVLYTGEVTSVTLPGSEGEFTVLNNHASLMATLSAGRIRYSEDGETDNTVEIGAGIVNVDDNIVSVCIY